MKKIIVTGLIGFIICTAFNKSATLNDYRDAYTGSYFCKRDCQRLVEQTSLRTYSDTMTIAVSKDVLDSVLKITIGRNIMQVKLVNAVLYPYPRDAQGRGRFFASDSISFFPYTGKAPNSCSYRGKKK